MESFLESVRNGRSRARRVWDVSSSRHWYTDEGFWLDLATEESIYKRAMIDTEDRLIDRIVQDIAGAFRFDAFVALGPGDGEKESRMLEAVGANAYIPIDINPSELDLAARTSPVTTVPLLMEFKQGLRELQRTRNKFIYLGSTFSNKGSFPYDILYEARSTMGPGDALYVSAQTLPDMKDLPLYLAQYERSGWCTELPDRLLGELGFNPDYFRKHVVFDPYDEEVQIRATCIFPKGNRTGLPIQAFDELVLMRSYKPPKLHDNLSFRARSRHWRQEHPVMMDGRQYTSTFEGRIEFKSGTHYPVTSR